MKRIIALIGVLIVLYNICFSQKVMDDHIVFYGTVKNITETDVIINDIKVLTNNYDKEEIRVYALMFNGPIWIRPDSTWIGKKVFGSAHKDENGVIAVNNYQQIMGKELSLTPNLSEFFVSDSVSLRCLGISDKPEVVFEATRKFTTFIQMTNCKQRADSFFTIIYDTSKYNFLREYAVYFLYHTYSKGECLYVNPFSLMKNLMQDKKLATFLRERAYYQLKSNSYLPNLINEYNYLVDIYKETDNKDYASYNLKELNSRAKVILNMDKELLKLIEKLNINKTDSIDTFKFKAQGNVLLLGKLSKVEDGIIELRDVELLDSISTKLNEISITCMNSDNLQFKKTFTSKTLDSPVLINALRKHGKYVIDLKDYPQIGKFYYSLTPDGNSICFFTAEKLSELNISSSPKTIISDIKDYLIKMRTGHYDSYRIFESKYCPFILYNYIWQFYKPPIHGIEYFPILETRTSIIPELPPFQNVLLDQIIYPQIENPNIKNLIQLYTAFINSNQSIMVKYGRFRLFELKKLLGKRISENELVISRTKIYF
jgi:hypothetical protein